ncbi:hypothetical protein [Salinispora vitiensis]|uniref:hypothetical protein n=1 Tax=Salinispora vitiensis TaxID=999544 RepID=UPI00036A1191
MLHFWVEPVLGLAGDDGADTVRVGAPEGAGPSVAAPPADGGDGDPDADGDSEGDSEGDGTSAAVVVGAGSVPGNVSAATPVGDGSAGGSASTLKATADSVTARDTTTTRC